VQQAFDVRSNTCHIHSYVHTLTHIQDFQSSTVLCKQPRETRILTKAMKARQKCQLAGPTTGCCASQETCIEEKQRVRQSAVVYTQKKERKISTHACTYTCACMCPPQLNRISMVCECALHVRVCVLLLFR
jgi:hypothetical protein